MQRLLSRFQYVSSGTRALLVGAALAMVLSAAIDPALLASSAEPLPGAGVWACGESLKVSPQMPAPAKNSVWSAEERQVRLFGGRGEYVGFQVVVHAGTAPLEQVSVQVQPPRSQNGATLSAENIDLYQEHYLKVTVPSQWEQGHPVPEGGAGEYPVQMVPLVNPKPGSRFTVPAGRNQPVWIDLWIPEEQAPGEYRSVVEVRSGSKVVEMLPLSLTVWRFTLPRETHLKTYCPTGPEQLRWAFGLDAEDEDGVRRLEDRCFQMAHQHRLNFQPTSEDGVEEEWGRRYRPYMDGSAFRDRLGKGVGQNLAVLGVDSDDKGEVQEYVRHAVQWWKGQHFPAELVCYVYDEPSDDDDFAEAAKRARWIREAAGSGLPLFLTTTRPAKLPKGLINTWGEIPAAEVPAHKAAGDKIWATNHGYAGGPYVDTPGYAGRSQGWMAWKMGLDAWQFWDVCYWTDRHNRRGPDGKRVPSKAINAEPRRFLTDTWTDPLTFDQTRNPREKYPIRLNGDGCLFYPGAPVGLKEPLASFTMKSLRRGLQDYEYLWLLRQKGGKADDLVSRVVPAPDKWAKNADAWDAARLELGKRLDAAW